MTKKYNKSIFHYTTMDGLLGILESQCLHASNAFFLNDLSEITHLRSHFSKFVATRYNEHVVKRSGKPPDGPLVALFADHLTAALFSGMRRSTEPFIVCFCQAGNEMAANDGLLSQWRGYGSDGGAAIEFSATKMTKLVKQNNLQREKPTILFGSVAYSKSRKIEKLNKIVSDMSLDALTNMFAHIDQFVKGRNPDDIKSTDMPEFMKIAKNTFQKLISRISAVSSYAKNHAFQEEREVRLVAAAPLSVHRHHKIRGGLFVPFIKLFDDEGTYLPIERIIIGPQKDQNRKREAVENYLGNRNLRIEVRCSSIPYVAT